MKRKNVDRLSHAGKDRFEKEAYRQFVASKSFLDKTEKDSVDTTKTNESSFEEEGKDDGEVKKKSNILKAKDFFHNNWFTTIVGGVISGVIILIITGYISLYNEQGIQKSQISTINDDISTLQSENIDDDNSFSKLKEKYDIFSTEVSKDIEYIKKALNL